VYETVLTEHPEIGSVCSGGRYDDLAGYYTDKKLPGVGISIGLTRLFYVLEEQGMLSDGMLTSPADALVIALDDSTLPAAVAAATALREAGVRTQLHFEKRKLGAKLGYADKLGIPFVVLVGEDEAAGKVSVKNLSTREQATASPAEAAQIILTSLRDRSDRRPIRDD
jgi:histidyl-tRNA synthetase